MLRYNYFPGCTLKTTGKELEKSALKVSPRLGFELVELPRWHCCGTVVALSSDNKMHSIGAVRTLIRVQETGDPKVVSLCSICYNTLARVNHRFNTDAEFRDAVVKFMDDEPEYEGKVQSLHYLQVLRDEITYDRVKEAVIRPLSGLKVAPYYGCLLLRPKEFSIDPNYESPTVLEDLIESLGAEAVDNPYKNECCGSYETVHNPDQVASMVYNIIEGARKNGAEVLVTSCPLCHFNLDRRQQILIEATPDFQPMPILYFTELMEMALIEERPQWTNHTVSVDEILDRFYK
ncbi:MAG TPA: heterodisulfide reductase, subunit B [candidate division Zixibacteria bacterium]|nr:heterodisulfide reductase, subunit B [candidate division Zixibacteria bacterium]